MRDNLEEQRKRLNLMDVSDFEPTTNEVAPWMRRIDVFVLTSETESFPNALLEAMSCGRCVIASRVGGVPEMVEDGANGLLFDPGDVEDLAAKMIRVSIDAGTRRSLAAEATRTARERFSIERNVRCIENLYASLLGQSVPRTEQAELVER